MTKRGAVRRVGNRRAWAVRFLLIALAVFLFLKAVQLHGQLNAKASEIAAVDEKSRAQAVVNEGYEEQLEDVDGILENNANDSGNYLPGQQVFQG